MNGQTQTLHNYVIVNPNISQSVTEAGLVIPDSAISPSFEGEVISVGPGHYQNGSFVPTTVRKGDRVLFSKFADSWIQYEGKKYLIMPETDIFTFERVEGIPDTEERANTAHYNKPEDLTYILDFIVDHTDFPRPKTVVYPSDKSVKIVFGKDSNEDPCVFLFIGDLIRREYDVLPTGTLYPDDRFYEIQRSVTRQKFKIGKEVEIGEVHKIKSPDPIEPDHKDVHSNS